MKLPVPPAAGLVTTCRKIVWLLFELALSSTLVMLKKFPLEEVTKVHGSEVAEVYILPSSGRR